MARRTNTPETCTCASCSTDALDRIADLLDGQTWSPDTVELIAEILRGVGYAIADVDDQDDDDQDDDDDPIVQTACQHCGQDIEGTTGGDTWRDRAGDTSCPYPGTGKVHTPIVTGGAS